MTLKVSSEAWQNYTKMAMEMGFTAIAAAPIEPVIHEQVIRDWVANGNHAEMHWYERGLDKRMDPTLVIEGAASIIMLITPYEKEACALGDMKLARYACGDDYHDVLIKPIRSLCDRMVADYPETKIRGYVDTGPVLERYWAERAGLGWIGKNGNLITRKQGSYVFLASMVTNLEVPYGKPHANFCGQCRACIDACPTDAIFKDGQVDSRRCISYLNIEHRGDFVKAPAFEQWAFGCDICQEVCPWPNKFAAEPVFDAFKPRAHYANLNAETLLNFEQTEFSTAFRKSPIKRTKMAGIKRNIRHLLNLD